MSVPIWQRELRTIKWASLSRVVSDGSWNGKGNNAMIVALSVMTRDDDDDDARMYATDASADDSYDDDAVMYAAYCCCCPLCCWLWWCAVMYDGPILKLFLIRYRYKLWRARQNWTWIYRGKYVVQLWAELMHAAKKETSIECSVFSELLECVWGVSL